MPTTLPRGHLLSASIRRVLALMAFGSVVATAAVAQDLPVPKGEVVLTVTGDIRVGNQGESAVFDLEMLQALGATSFETSTPWTEGVHSFTGVSLAALMAVLGVTEGSLRATAINDYAVDIPVSDAVDGGPILAYLQDGKPMSIREKGPLWVVYPYDLNEDYQSEVSYSRSIWQLVSLDVTVD